MSKPLITRLRYVLLLISLDFLIYCSCIVLEQQRSLVQCCDSAVCLSKKRQSYGKEEGLFHVQETGMLNGKLEINLGIAQALFIYLQRKS